MLSLTADDAAPGGAGGPTAKGPATVSDGVHVAAMLMLMLTSAAEGAARSVLKLLDNIFNE